MGQRRKRVLQLLDPSATTVKVVAVYTHTVGSVQTRAGNNVVLRKGKLSMVGAKSDSLPTQTRDDLTQHVDCTAPCSVCVC